MANEFLIDNFIGPAGLALEDPSYMPQVGGPYVDDNPSSTMVLDGNGGCLAGPNPAFVYSSVQSSIPAPAGCVCEIEYDLYVNSLESGGDFGIHIDADHFVYLELDMEKGSGGAHWGLTEVIGDRHNPANWINLIPDWKGRHYDIMGHVGAQCHVKLTIAADGHHMDINVDDGGWTFGADITLGPAWYPGPLAPEPGLGPGRQVSIRNVVARSVTPPKKIHVTQAEYDQALYLKGVLDAHSLSASQEVQKVIGMMQVGADSVVTNELDLLTAQGQSLDSLMAAWAALEGKAT